jgi:pimeloyl-ACP methyl ester carboxylesterase
MRSTLDVGAVRIACDVSGEGPPLLLMHGAEGSRRMFDPIVPLLMPHFTVISYDQRDCGETENPATPAFLADLAADAKALLLALGHARSHIYGTSFGGRVAQALSLLHPEVVDRLVLGSTWPLPQVLQELNEQAVQEIMELRQRLPDSAAALAAYFFPPHFLELQRHLEDIFKNAQPQSERGRRRSQTVTDGPALDIRNIEAPTLLLAGELDRVVPPRVTLGMADVIPNVRSTLLEGVGHAGVLQVPEEIAAHLRRFLRPTQ